MKTSQKYTYITTLCIYTYIPTLNTYIMYIHTYIPTLNTYVKCSIFLREKLKCVVFGIVVTLCGKVLGQVECCELFLDIT